MLSLGYNGNVKNDIEAETSRERPRFTVDCFLVVKNIGCESIRKTTMRR